MRDYKRYLILTFYGSEGWSISAETNEWEEAIKAREEARSLGGNEVIIVEHCPLVVLDGRFVEGVNGGTNGTE